MTVPLAIGSTRQLFLDDLLIERLEGCRRQFHRPVRHPDNPRIEADRPWEQGGNGVYLFGGTVLFDAEERIFKMWYRTSVVERRAEQRRAGGTPDGGYRTCYAVSSDGLRWEKPDLDQVEHEGSTANNMLPPGTGGRGHIRRPNLIKDPGEPDPAKRYKMLYMDELEGRFGLARGYSADGIHWRMNVGRPVHFEPPVRPNGELFGWDPRIRRYVLFHPEGRMIPADVDGRMVRNDFGLVRTTSPDFETWGETVEVVRRDASMDAERWNTGHVGVLSALLYTGDLYVGFLDTCATRHVEDVPEERWEAYSVDHADHRTELVASRDGVVWTRVAPHWWFLPPGLWGTWDRELVALTKPIVHGDRILFFYSGRNIPCGSQTLGHFQHGLVHKVVDGQRLGWAIGLATLRLDGFASLDGYDPAGSVTTRPLRFEGSRLVLNARAPERPFAGVPWMDAQTGRPSVPIAASGTWGSLAVEIQDAAGAPLAGFSAADFDAFTGDQVRHVASWRGRADVAPLAGRPVRLRFILRNAALYAFQFTPEGAAAGAPS
jgi:hypothetical protein